MELKNPIVGQFVFEGQKLETYAVAQSPSPADRRALVGEARSVM